MVGAGGVCWRRRGSSLGGCPVDPIAPLAATTAGAASRSSQQQRTACSSSAWNRASSGAKAHHQLYECIVVLQGTRCQGAWPLAGCQPRLANNRLLLTVPPEAGGGGSVCCGRGHAQQQNCALWWLVHSLQYQRLSAGAALPVQKCEVMEGLCKACICPANFAAAGQSVALVGSGTPCNIHDVLLTCRPSL